MPVFNKTALKSAISTAFASSVNNTDVITQLHDIVDSYEDLIPSLTQVQINALTPVVSQIVFNTDLGQLQYYDGSQWQYLASTSDAIMSVTRTLTSAEILALFTTPITLIPAQGANRLIDIDKIIWSYNYNSIQYAGTGVDVTINYETATTQLASNGDQIITAVADYVRINNMGAFNGSVNDAVIIQSDASITTGNGTLTITIYYRVITV